MREQTQSMPHDSLKPCVPEVGDWILIRGGTSFDVQGPVSTVTAKQTRYHWYNRERRIDSASIVFSGSEGECRELASVLIASQRKRDVERADAELRHQQRFAAAVASLSNRNDGSSPKNTEVQ